MGGRFSISSGHGTTNAPIILADDDGDPVPGSANEIFYIDDDDVDDDNIDDGHLNANVDNFPVTVDLTSDDDVSFVSAQARQDPEVRWGFSSEDARRRARRPKKAFTAFEPRIKPLGNITFLQGHPMGQDVILEPGMVVELRPIPGSPSKDEGDFLKIRFVYEASNTSDIFLRGLLYRRTKTLEGMLPRKLNEVYQVLQHNLEDPRDIGTQSLHDVPVTDVVSIRCLRHSNRSFPQDSFRTTEDLSGKSTDYIAKRGQLTCRWKRIFTYKYSEDLATGYRHETSIERIFQSECDEGCGTSDRALRRAVSSDIPVVDVEAQTAEDKDSAELAETVNNILRLSPTKKDLQDIKNTFADFFCGAGGATIGAKKAGFKAVYGVDHNEHACATQRLNNPEMEVFEENIHDNLVKRMQAHAHVRVAHMSTVCKTLSPAYTTPGRNHDDNEATLYCISEILRKATPMVATLEQTFGAMGPAKRQIFAAFVLQFTSMGYSVRWKVHDLSEYGVPQQRRRLIMISACPGHPLPAFPAPTHGPGLRPYATIHDAITPIRPHTPNHFPNAVKQRNFLHFSPHQFLKGCITTSGGANNVNYHPSGTRDLTEREYASLQTFPLDYVFAGTRSQIICQVGNAVPPAFSEKLFKSVRKTLDEVDREEAQYDEMMQRLHEHGHEQDAPIVLDDDDVMVDVPEQYQNDLIELD